MTFDYFFWQEDMPLPAGVELGFELYGVGHLLWLAAMAVGTAVITFYYKQQRPERRAGIRKFFAVAILCSEIYKDTVLVILDVSLIGYLPIHLCGMAIFAMLIHAFGTGKLSQIVGQTIIYLFMPGAMAALLFCNWTEYPVFANFMSFHSFIFHGWIVCYAVMCYAAGDVKPEYKAMWKGLGCIFLTALPIYVFNKLTGENYLFINEASEGSPLVFLWDMFGTRFGEVGYLLSYAALIIIVLHVLSGVYYILGRALKKNRAC